MDDKWQELIGHLTQAIDAQTEANKVLADATQAVTAYLSEQRNFIPISEAAKSRAIGAERQWYLDRIHGNDWKYGREYFDLSTGDRPNYRVNIAAILRWLRIHPAKRPKQRALKHS